MQKRETCLAPARNPTMTPRSSHSSFVTHCTTYTYLVPPTFTGTIRNAYKFVVGKLSDLDAKGMKTAFKTCDMKKKLDSARLEYGLVADSYGHSNNFKVCPDECPTTSQVTHCSIQMVYKILFACRVEVHFQNGVPEILPSSLVALHLYNVHMVSFWYS